MLFMLTWDPRKQSFIPFFTFDVMAKVLSLQSGAPADEYDGADPYAAVVRSVPGLGSLPSARILETFGKLRGESAESGDGDDGPGLGLGLGGDGQGDRQGSRGAETGDQSADSQSESTSVARSGTSTPAPRPGTAAAAAAGARRGETASSSRGKVEAGSEALGGDGGRREDLFVQQMLGAVPLYEYPDHLSVHVPPSIDSNISEAFKEEERYKQQLRQEMMARQRAVKRDAINQLAMRMMKEEQEGKKEVEEEGEVEEVLEGSTPRFDPVDTREIRQKLGAFGRAESRTIDRARRREKETELREKRARVDLLRNNVEENDALAFLAALENYGAIGSLVMGGGGGGGGDFGGSAVGDGVGVGESAHHRAGELLEEPKRPALSSPSIHLQIPTASVLGQANKDRSTEVPALLPVKQEEQEQQYVRASTSAEGGAYISSKQSKSKAAAGLGATGES